MCDVDQNKIGHKYTPYDPVKRETKESIPIIHFTKAKPPFVICVKLVSLVIKTFRVNNNRQL